MIEFAMKKIKTLLSASLAVCLVSGIAVAQEKSYCVYFGNTHSHCNYSGDIAIAKAKKGLKPDPANVPEIYFRLAKENGYDFYCITDHSQYPEYTPEAWADLAARAEQATCPGFVAIRGYEHSENDGPEGKGHMNVYNSATFLNALADSVGLEYFQHWLSRDENAKVIACFNHPGPKACNDFHCYDEKVRSRFCLMELINGRNSKLPAYINALSKGWKLSPVAGCDNHSRENISRWQARTGILATELTYDGVMEAFSARRTFATHNRNLSVVYTVNGRIMGSDIPRAARYRFDIEVNDPDTDKPEDTIRRIEILGEDGRVVASSEFGSHRVHWQPTVVAGESYYYVLVYNAASGDSAVAYAAPVWPEAE